MITTKKQYEKRNGGEGGVLDARTSQREGFFVSPSFLEYRSSFITKNDESYFKVLKYAIFAQVFLFFILL